jgi:hypothetical protein
MASPYGVVIRFTHCLTVDGFPKLLRHMLKEADFPYSPEYTIYVQEAPYGLDNYVVECRVWARRIDGTSSWTFHCYGSTPEAATQSVAYQALLRVRFEVTTICNTSFRYVPARMAEYPAPYYASHELVDSPRCIRTARLVEALDVAYRLTEYELHATRRRLGRALALLEPACDSWILTGREILHGPFPPTPPDWCFPEVVSPSATDPARDRRRSMRDHPYAPIPHIPILMGRDRAPFPFPLHPLPENPDVYLEDEMLETTY